MIRFWLTTTFGIVIMFITFSIFITEIINQGWFDYDCAESLNWIQYLSYLCYILNNPITFLMGMMVVITILYIYKVYTEEHGL